MTTTLAQGQVISATAPLLTISTIFDGGRLADPDGADGGVVEYQVYDPSNVELTMGRQVVNLVTHRLGLGHYFANFTVPAAQARGRGYRAVYYYTEKTGESERTYEQPFEVVTSVDDPLGTTYAYVDDIRDEGVDEALADDARLHKLLVLASSYIEEFTGRWFEHRHSASRQDGRGRDRITFGVPIIAAGTVALDFGPIVGDGGVDVPFEDFVVYNRHLTQRLLIPDDRDGPRIELYRAPHPDYEIFRDRIGFARGDQNVVVNGVFGYTEPTPRLLHSTDPVGRTPALIQRVAVLLALRNLPLLNPADRRQRELRERAIMRPRLLSERQSGGAQYVTADLTGRGGDYGPGSFVGHFTGDPEIDTILVSFKRPIALSAV